MHVKPKQYGCKNLSNRKDERKYYVIRIKCFIKFCYYKRYYSITKIEDGEYHWHYVNSIFSINKYTLANRYKEHFKTYGVPTEIEEYPKLNALVQEMKEINKTSSEYNSVFNKHRKQALKVAKEDLDEILEEIKDLERKRLQLNKIYDDVVKTLDDKIVQEYGYIDPNIRLNEIKQAL